MGMKPMNQVEKQLKSKPRGRPWPPGTSGNPSGRRRGSLNKLTLAVGGTLAVNSRVEPEPKPRKYDGRRPHAHSMLLIGGRPTRVVRQDGEIFCRDCGELLGMEGNLRKNSCSCRR